MDTQNLRDARMRDVARAIWEWRLGVGSSSSTKHGFTFMGSGSRILGRGGEGGEGGRLEAGWKNADDAKGGR